MKIIVGTPRSGTTFITKWLAYNKKLHLLGHDFSGEYFDGSNLNFIFNNNWKPNQKITTEQLEIWTKKSIDIIPSDRVIFKVHPFSVSPTAKKFISDRPVILIERKDKMAQFLSLGIAMSTDMWFKYNPNEIQKVKPFYYKKEWIDFLNKHLNEYENIKKSHDNIEEIIYYEDLKNYSAIPHVTPLKQNKETNEEKLSLVINSNELVEWINELR